MRPPSRPSEARREALRKFAKRNNIGYSGGGSFKGTNPTFTENPVKVPEGYETRDSAPAGQKIPSTPGGRRLQRRQAGVSDVRTASQAQVRRLKRLGLL